MYRSAKFPPPDAASLQPWLRESSYGSVLAGGENGPDATLIPYVWLSPTAASPLGAVEVHLVAEDPVARALTDTPTGAFLITEPLSLVPHTVFDPLDTSRTMMLFRSAVLRGRWSLDTDPTAIAGHLNRLAEHLEPALPRRPVTDSQEYGPRLGRLVMATLHIREAEAKWKLAQDQPAPVRRQIMRFLGDRATALDLYTQAVLGAYWNDLGLD
jgi:predicted FMN-binding regulatory protein PaiB